MTEPPPCLTVGALCILDRTLHVVSSLPEIRGAAKILSRHRPAPSPSPPLVPTLPPPRPAGKLKCRPVTVPPR